MEGDGNCRNDKLTGYIMIMAISYSILIDYTGYWVFDILLDHWLLSKF